MKKTLLINPAPLYAPTWGIQYTLKSYLFTLFSFLKTNNMQVDVLDLENEIGRPKNNKEAQEFEKKAFQILARQEFDIAAISCWTSLHYLGCIAIADMCKKINPDCTIVTGGYHPTAVPEDFIFDNSPFDYIVQEEGELALLEIIKSENQHKNNNMPEIVQGQILDLNRELIKFHWKSYKYHKDIKMGTLYLSRGCPFKCSFCMERCKTHKWRSYTVDNAIKIIEELISQLDPDKIWIDDACFGLNKVWRREFLNRLIDKKIDKLFWAECRTDTLEREDIGLLRNMNFVIDLGADTFSRRMLHTMNKTSNPDSYLYKSIEIMRCLNAYEVPYKVYLLFNHPGETYESYNETMNFIKDFSSKEQKFSGFFLGQNYKYFPGSYISRRLSFFEDKYGTVIKNKCWWKETGDHEKLSSANVPSKSVADNFGDNLDYWKEDLNAINFENQQKRPEIADLLFNKMNEDVL
ncbi:B12-binding domain-containing radical SAM protein [Verrucomicrobiota bacterium]